MGSDPDSKTALIPIAGIGVTLTSEVGADDLLVYVDVVPDGRDGDIIYVRTLHDDEVYEGVQVFLDTTKGETIRTRPGAISIALKNVNQTAKVEDDGYANITNVLWTWFQIGTVPAPDLYHSLLAAGRRLDASRYIWRECNRHLEFDEAGFIRQRQMAFETYGLAEVLMVTIGRVAELIESLIVNFKLAIPLPELLEKNRATIREMRNAFEHIEDRALGRVRNRPHPDAQSVFSQQRFLDQGIIEYAGMSLNLRTQIPVLLIELRNFLYTVATAQSGPNKVLQQELNFFRNS